MSAESLKFLREAFGPKRYGLRAEELAEVLGKRSLTPRVIERVRDKIRNGVYPNGKNIEGIWQLPMDEVAEILDPTPKASPVLPSSSQAPRRAGRRRSEIGPRLAFIREAEFWAQTFRAMGFPQDAQDLEGEARALRNEGRLARDIERSNEEHAALASSTPQPPASSNGHRGGL